MCFFCIFVLNLIVYIMVTVQITDNFLEKNNFIKLQEYCKKDFSIVELGGKEFSLLETPKDLLPLLEIQGLKQVVSFVRSAYKGFDEDLHVHADNIIDGYRIEYASVLYVNDDKDVTENGTCFYTHQKYGSRLHKNVSNEEYDRIITLDSNDEEKWKRTSYISNVPNRYLIYEANLFHGKFPKIIEKGVRKVVVTFYTKPNS